MPTNHGTLTLKPYSRKMEHTMTSTIRTLDHSGHTETVVDLSTDGGVRQAEEIIAQAREAGKALFGATPGETMTHLSNPTATELPQDVLIVSPLVGG